MQFAQVLISAAFKLALIALRAPLIWFAWVYVLETFVLAAGYSLALARDGASWRTWTVSRSTLRYLVNESWPMLVYGVALYIQAKIDQVMIGDMDPHDGVAGARKRLAHLAFIGHDLEALGDAADEIVAAAIERFQDERGLEVTGDLDAATLEALRDAHGR